MNNVPSLQIKELAFAYPDGNQALFGVNLTVNKGERVALLRQQDVDPGRVPALRARKRALIETIMARDAEVRSLTEDWMHELREILESAGNVQKLHKTYDQG
jgi:ABC-type transport system involved in cytochrome bd biosynthesis fused ATPase/permease subunit